MELKRETLVSVCKKFIPDETVTEITRIEFGHINDTFKIVTKSKKMFILQRINTDIFKNPEGLISNIASVTDFLRKKIIAAGGDPSRETLTLLKNEDSDYLQTDITGVYRMYIFISDAECYNKLEHDGMFFESARAFGRFQNLLSDFDATKLHETIKNFHNTPVRFINLEKAIAENRSGRKNNCLPEIDFFLARKDFCSFITDRLADGRLPYRVTHNDTKLNNVMIDNKTGKGVCVIDLDTVMPGSLLYDFGDSIRFGASSAAEDENDISRVYMVSSLFGEYTRGFLSEAGSSMTTAERKLLPEGAIMMTLECGMRFLTDYLDGDTYFRTTYRDQNLFRARTQMKLVSDMESKLCLMRGIVSDAENQTL